MKLRSLLGGVAVAVAMAVTPAMATVASATPTSTPTFTQTLTPAVTFSHMSPDTSPDTLHVYNWGNAGYQIQGTGTYVTCFVGSVYNEEALGSVAASFTVTGPGYNSGAHAITIPSHDTWNWALPQRRDMAIGAYTVTYRFVYSRGGIENMSWSYNVE